MVAALAVLLPFLVVGAVPPPLAPWLDLSLDDPLLARDPQASDRLPLDALRGVLRLAQHVELLAREEVGVACDDRRLLGGLLLPHPDRASLLRALLEEEVEPLLEGTGVEHGHSASSCPRRRRSRDVSRPSSSSDS